jgi:hypothetical protein
MDVFLIFYLVFAGPLDTAQTLSLGERRIEQAGDELHGRFPGERLLALFQLYHLAVRDSRRPAASFWR